MQPNTFRGIVTLSFFILSSTLLFSTPEDLWGAEMSVLDPLGFPIASAGGFQGRSSVAWHEREFFVVWMDDLAGSPPDIYGAAVSEDGEVSTVGAFRISLEGGQFPQVLGNELGLFVVWSGADRRPGIYGRRVTLDGDWIDVRPIEISATGARPVIAWNGEIYLVVWADGRSGGNSDIYGARITAEGEVIDPTGIPIATGPAEQAFPHLAWGGDSFFVVWNESDGRDLDIYGTRVRGDGRVRDPLGIPIATADGDQAHPRIAWEGNQFLVVWSAVEAGGENWNIHGMRLSGDGRLIDEGSIPISTAEYPQTNPDVHGNDGDFFVVWTDRRSGVFDCGDAPCADIYGTVVQMNGNIHDPDGIPVATAEKDQFFPSVVFGGEGFLVTWEDTRDGTSDIYGARIKQESRGRCAAVAHLLPEQGGTGGMPGALFLLGLSIAALFFRIRHVRSAAPLPPAHGRY